MSGLLNTPKVPTVEPAKVIPISTEEQIATSRRRTVAENQQTGGRLSTLLSTGGREKLGA